MGRQAGSWRIRDLVLQVEILNVTAYRFATPLIQITYLQASPANDNIFAVDIAAGQTFYSVGDGVYLLLYPLPVGVHTLEFNNIQYTITVSPR